MHNRAAVFGICPVKFSHSHNNRRKGIHYMSKPKILIVDDSQLNRELLACMLEDNYDICEAENGEQAVEILERCHKDFKLVLLDLIMPVMDGYEATREIRKFSLQVPIIAVTAFAYASDEQKAMENGFNAYMSKPINAGQLRTKITSILQRHVVFM